MSHGSGDEENYWPGYVDALTSMVQVLAFVMMMLAMAIFVLSQNVSKTAVEAIAKAMKVDTSPETSLSQLTRAVVDAAEKAERAQERRSPAGEAAPPSGAARTPADKGEAASDAPSAAAARPADGKAAAAAEFGETAEPASAAAPKPADAPASGPSPKPAEAAEKPAEAKPAATPTPEASPAPAQVAALPPAPPRSNSERLAPAIGKSVLVHFPERSFVATAEAKKTIEAFLTDAKGGRIVIQAYASSAKSALSDARHLAFYRGMTLRGELVAHKFDPDKIKVRVLDVADEARASAVELVSE